MVRNPRCRTRRRSNRDRFRPSVLTAIERRTPGPDSQVTRILRRRYSIRPLSTTRRAPGWHRARGRVTKRSLASSMNFFSELKRRNVYKVAVAYAVVGWLVVQVATQTFPFFDVPNWAVRLVILLVVIGFPIALIIAWAFELTPEGLKRTDAESAPAVKKTGSRAWIYVVIAGV